MAIRNIIEKAEQEYPPSLKQEVDPIAGADLNILSGYINSTASNIVFTTGNQNVSGTKTFVSRPTVNGTGVLLSGEAAQLPETIVYTTGTQTISGEKTFSASLFVFSGANVVFVDNTGIVSGQWEFSNRPTVNGTGVLLSGEAAQLPETILYTTGNQIKSGRLIIGDSIVDPGSSYTLSLQRNFSNTWLEILNHSGAGQGVFFGINGNDFEQWNYQGGDILFFTSEDVSDGYVRLTIKNDGKVGIGTQTPSEKLEVAGNIIANNLVYNSGDQYIDGQKIFRGEIRINNLYVTGTETVVNTTNTNVASNYLLLNATGGALDAGIFIVTGDNLTGINDSGAIIGYDVPSNRWVFGNTSRNSDLSQLEKIAGINDIENYSGFANNTFVTSTGNNIISGDNTFYSDKYIFSGADIVISGGTFNSNIRPFVNGTGVLLSGEAAAGQNSFIITLSNSSDTQSAGNNHFGSLAMGFSNNANNRKFPVLEACVVKKAVWSQAHGTLGNPSQNSTGYFINTTTNETGIISTTINNTSSSPTNYIATFSPPITISTGDYIVCNLFGPTYATTYPGTVRNTVHLYCYN